MAKQKNASTQTEEPLEKKLWGAADKLRKNMDAAEYKHIVLGLVFLKYISDAFEELHTKLVGLKSEGAEPEDKNEYIAEKVFYVPKIARWTHLRDHARQATIGKEIDDAMDAIEKDNTSLRGILPKVFAQEKLDKASLGGLIDLFSSATLGTKEAQSKDILGRVFEYFLGEFALAEGKQSGSFYTPESVVRLLVQMLEPYEGRVFDPCCGSGGMFVQSEKFVEQHSDRFKKHNSKKLVLNPADNISIFGQESNQTTWRLCKMNLAIRGIDSSNVKWNNEGSFLNDAHKDLRADYVLANPPFNDSDWSGELLQNDARWSVLGKKLPPPAGNANYAWIQHFLYHLAPNGRAGFVLASSSLNTLDKTEYEIRKELVEGGHVECIVDLPAQMFFNTQIPASLWFIRKRRLNEAPHENQKILFIDAQPLGKFVTRKHKDLSERSRTKIVETYLSWKRADPVYKDELGFCFSADISEVRANNFVLSPRWYVAPMEQEVSTEIAIADDATIAILHEIISKISTSEKNIVIKRNSTKEDVNIADVERLWMDANELQALSTRMFLGIISDYFLNFSYRSDDDALITSEVGPIPNGWSVHNFGDLFVERRLKVEQHGYCPTLYSVTNSGIQSREQKYTKELSQNTKANKIAFRGDMVFGLSREIPNLDVFMDTEGAFSPAYSIYQPHDPRFGILVGKLMRLKLMEQTDILKGGAREGRVLDKARLAMKMFALPPSDLLNELWSSSTTADVEQLTKVPQSKRGKPKS